MGVHAVFEMAGDVFDDDDGVIDDESGGDGQGHEREIVDGVIREIHDAERADERDGDGDAGDEGGPPVAQEEEDDEDDERSRR